MQVFMAGAIITGLEKSQALVWIYASISIVQHFRLAPLTSWWMTRGCQPIHWPTLPKCLQSKEQPQQGLPIFSAQYEALGHHALSISPIRERPKILPVLQFQERVREGGNGGSFQWQQDGRCTGENSNVKICPVCQILVDQPVTLFSTKPFQKLRHLCENEISRWPLVTLIRMLWWNGTLIVATLPEQHKSMLGIFSISVTDSELLAIAKEHLWMKLIIIDVSIQSSHGYCSRHWFTERLCDSFKHILAHNINICKQKHESHL